MSENAVPRSYEWRGLLGRGRWFSVHIQTPGEIRRKDFDNLLRLMESHRDALFDDDEPPPTPSAASEAAEGQG